jgi:hypothetical protein
MLAVVLAGALWPAAAAGHSKKSDSTREVLAIVSPLALPACSTSGSATLLVPIVGGVLQNGLHLPKSVSVSDLLLNAIGPVYVVCGDLPASPGTQCSLDDQLAAVWPKSLTSESLSPPAPLGDIIDSLSAALKILHLNLLDATEQALKCRVKTATAPPSAPGSLPAPAAPVPASVLPSTGGPPAATTLPTGSVNVEPTLPSVVVPGPRASAGSPQLAQPVTANPSLVSSITHRLPSAVVAMQVILAVLLAVVLAGSWLTSGRLRFAERHHKDSS